MGNEENVVQFIAEQFPKMEGWCDPQKGLEIARLVLNSKPQRIAEIGVFEGKSTLALAYACKLNGSGTVYAIDSWKKEDCIDDELTSNQFSSAACLHVTHQDSYLTWTWFTSMLITPNGRLRAMLSTGFQNLKLAAI
jgi:Methyltransferase domain